MRFTIDFMPAAPTGGLQVFLDGLPVAESPIPVEAAERAAAIMCERWQEERRAENFAAKSHRPGEDCNVCGGAGTDYIGRPCRYQIASR